MQIARVVLELSVKRQKWSRRTFRDHILEREIGDKGEAHFQRVSYAVQKAAGAGASVVVLPAYSLIDGAGGLSLRQWKRLPKRFGLDFLVGGTLAPRAVIPEIPDLWKEEGLFVAAKSGLLVPDLQYGPLPLSFGASFGITAISSSVGKVKQYPEIFRSVAERGQTTAPLLIFDMGHNQYGGRYKRRLSSVIAATRRLGSEQTFLLLSSWRWRGSASGCWAFENVADARYSKRLEVPTADGRADFVDVFHV